MTQEVAVLRAGDYLCARRERRGMSQLNLTLEAEISLGI